MFAIYKRELKSYFQTPAGYVFIGIFLLLGSVFFIIGNLAARSGSMLSLLSNMSYVWMLISPILSFKLLSARMEGGDQILFASSLSLTRIVLGKYLAACTILLISVLLSFVYPIMIAWLGTLYVPETAVGYLGFILLGFAFLALDMLIASLTRTPMVAVIASFGVHLLLWLSDLFAQAVSIPFISSLLSFLSLYERISPFLNGRLSLANLLFDLSFCAVMLFLCVRVLDSRRWRETA